MKKNLRKIVSLVLVLSMALAISVPAFAAEHTNRPIIGLGITEKTTNSQSITPFVYEVCNGKPYHDMVSRSYGDAYIILSDGSLEKYISWGAC